jgi:hypothetical protein
MVSPVSEDVSNPERYVAVPAIASAKDRSGQLIGTSNQPDDLPRVFRFVTSVPNESMTKR